ncbi:MAG: helix-turn-helix transcriptional regulator [Myxococcales bacterium]|nr:helix-turn-helix transcriptional regulator [Myxococcales bacterium]
MSSTSAPTSRLTHLLMERHPAHHAPHVGRNILTRRLDALIKAGILEKRAYSTRPPRFEYHLTDRGYDAAALLLAMMSYGESWSFEPGREPILGCSIERPAVVSARSLTLPQFEYLCGVPSNGKVRRESTAHGA